MTGTLVDARRPDSLAEALLRYIDSDELVAEHGEAGRQRVTERFGLSIMTEKYYSLYDECLAIPDAALTEAG